LPEKQSPVIIKTDAVRFETERKPLMLELQRAVQTIQQELESGKEKTLEIPLTYDLRIAVLQKNLKRNYEDFQPTEDADGDVWTFSGLKGAMEESQRTLDQLPERVGLAAARLSGSQSSIMTGDVNVTRTCAQYIQLEMTRVLGLLSKWQLVGSADALALRYARLDGVEGRVASVAGVGVDEIVSYRIQVAGDLKDRVVYVPENYGGSRLLVDREFFEKSAGEIQARGYFPPVSFLTDFFLPQMFAFASPEEWDFSMNFRSVFVKDLKGKYLSALR
jgi:hypothetical protein